MSSPYKELIALTKRHLNEEYDQDSRIWTNLETYNYFRSLTPPPKPVAEPAPQPQPRAAARPPPPNKEAPLPEKIQPQPKAQILPPKRHTQEMLKSDDKLDFADVRAVLKEVAPQLKIIDAIPNDALAKRIAQSWKETLPEVVLIATEATEGQQELLLKIAAAIRSLGYSAGCLEGTIDWNELLTAPHLKLILMTEQTMQQCGDLVSKHRYDRQRQRHFLDGRLLCPLPALDKLETAPALKTQLWNTIRQLLQ